jgi:hypothetical protein
MYPIKTIINEEDNVGNFINDLNFIIIIIANFIALNSKVFLLN